MIPTANLVRLHKEYTDVSAYLQGLHNDITANMSLLRTGSFKLDQKFATTLANLVKELPKEMWKQIAQEIEDIITDASHNGEHTLALAYGTDVSNAISVKDISTYLNGLTPKNVSDSTEYWVVLPEQATPSGGGAPNTP